jgi:hypothetical protein
MQCCSRDQRKQASATTSTHTSPHLNSCSQEVTLTWDLSHHIQQGCKDADERGNGIAPLSSHDVT